MSTVKMRMGEIKLPEVMGQITISHSSFNRPHFRHMFEDISSIPFIFVGLKYTRPCKLMFQKQISNKLKTQPTSSHTRRHLY
jgi:hypothetical protein